MSTKGESHDQTVTLDSDRKKKVEDWTYSAIWCIAYK